MNQPLATVYYMKEDQRQIWSQPDKQTATRVLEDWIRRAEASCIKILQKFAGTLAMHRTGILAYYDCRISTGPLEGTNNKIRTMQRQAYGFRDKEFLKLKILAIHEAKYAVRARPSTSRGGGSQRGSARGSTRIRRLTGLFDCSAIVHPLASGSPGEARA